jgi:hypothetical protein
MSYKFIFQLQRILVLKQMLNNKIKLSISRIYANSLFQSMEMHRWIIGMKIPKDKESKKWKKGDPS